MNFTYLQWIFRQRTVCVFVFTLAYFSTQAQPGNDECTSPIILPVGNQSCTPQVVSVVGATPSSNNDPCFGGGIEDVWFEIQTATPVFTVSIGNFITGSDYYLSIYDNGDCLTDNQNLVFCDYLSPNTDYNIGGNTGNYTLRLASVVPGMLELCVLDYAGCTLSVTATNTPATCSGWNGTATALPTGGSGNYSYSWQGQMNCAGSGGNTQTVNGLCPDNYTVIVTDNISGCLAAATTVVLPTFPSYFTSQSDLDNFPSLHPGATSYPCNSVYIGYPVNNGITNIDGLSQITSYNGEVVIFGEYTLNSIAGFQNVQTFGAGISIFSTNLTDLLPLSSFIYSPVIEIYDNPVLSSLNGLDNFDALSLDWLYIQDNSNLSICETSPICDYLAVPTNVALIDNNNTGCNTRAEVESACLILPIELLSFKARKLGNKTLLEWSTSSEVNNSHFEVQHSNNANSFEPIGQVAGSGSTANTKAYSFSHEDVKAGLHYYRLKQVDFDGTFTFSDIVAVDFSINKTILVSPNPTKSFIKITRGIMERITILDAYGRQVKEGVNIQSIDCSDLPSGVYVVMMYDGIQVYSEKIIKE
jgi:hypothetical protein